jgi:hypothetical protein
VLICDALPGFYRWVLICIHVCVCEHTCIYNIQVVCMYAYACMYMYVYLDTCSTSHTRHTHTCTCIHAHKHRALMTYKTQQATNTIYKHRLRNCDLHTCTIYKHRAIDNLQTSRDWQSTNIARRLRYCVFSANSMNKTAHTYTCIVRSVCLYLCVSGSKFHTLHTHTHTYLHTYMHMYSQSVCLYLCVSSSASHTLHTHICTYIHAHV